METWCELIAVYPDEAEPKNLAKALRIANSMLCADLAPFEIEWLVTTLLNKPVSVFKTIQSEHQNEPWFKTIADSFKIISKLVVKYWDVLENYSESIVQLCLLPFDPLTKKEAVHCLINVLKKPGVTVDNVSSLVDSLETGHTCMAPLALLVGTICRFHPESVQQDCDRIFRIYLNKLQPKDVTVTVVSAVLQGLDGLFENFGRDLHIDKLNAFYSNLSRKFAKIYKCLEPLLSILSSHAALFKERLAEDQVLRIYLWGINKQEVKNALISIYAVVFDDATKERILDIVQSEIQPRLSSESSLVKHTALRILIQVKIRHQLQVGGFRPDALEFQLRLRIISYQDSDLVSICLESQEPYTKSLLMSVIMYSENIPETLRKDVLVNGILAATKDNRKMALNLLVQLSRQDGGLEKYSEVWKGILTDEQSKDILDETLRHIARLLQAFIDGQEKDLDQVLSLSAVLTLVLSVSETNDALQFCELLKPIIFELSKVLCVKPSYLLYHKFVCPEMFEDNTILKKLLEFLNSNMERNGIHNISLLQTILNKEVADTKILIKCVSEMNKLLKSGDNVNLRQVANITKKILKLKSKDMSTSDSRVLVRDISMFEGEHGNYLEKENFLDDVYSVLLKNKISINIMNYEIDLVRTLQIALLWEHPDTLYGLLVVVAANLRDRPSPALQHIACRCIHSMFRSNRTLDVTPVLHMSDTVECVRQILESISGEVESDVRRMLCDSLQVILLHDLGSDINVEQLNLVAEYLIQMISNDDQGKYQCGLDIARIFLSTLHQNDALTLKYLSSILILTSKDVSKDFYQEAGDLFIEKIHIFKDESIRKTISDVIKIMKMNKNKIHLEYILEFLKKLFVTKGFEVKVLIDEIFDDLDCAESSMDKLGDVGVFANVLQILAMCKPIFGFDENSAMYVTSKDQYSILYKILDALNKDDSVEVLTNSLQFLTVYADVLVDVKKEETIQCICLIIEKSSKTSVIIIKTDLANCITTYKSITQELPESIKESFRKWCENLNVHHLNEMLNERLNALIPCSDDSDTFSDDIKSLNIMNKIFDIPIFETKNWTKDLLNSSEKLKKGVVKELLSISARNLDVSDFECMLKNHIHFVKEHLEVYFEKIMEANVDFGCDFFIYVLNYFVNNYNNHEKYYEKVVELVENYWPRLDDNNIKEKMAVASDILRLPKDVGALVPVQWVMGFIPGSDDNLEEKIKMVTMLPGGDVYSACYRHMAGYIPTRLSDMQDSHAAVFRGLLDHLASTGDLTLLDIIVTLAAADETIGWWDDAYEACMETLADRREEKIYDVAYRESKKRSGLGACKRVLVPLLKYSTRSFCEQYVTKIIAEVVTTLKTGYREPSNTDVYQDRVLSYAKAFAILQVVFKKLSTKSLESGPLNAAVGGNSNTPWHIVKIVCSASVTLITNVQCPDGASDEMRRVILRLQCAAYNCLTAAICKRSPSQKQYGAVFNTDAWSKIVDPDVEYEFQPRGYWSGSKPREQSNGAPIVPTTFTATMRTRIFMTTLSENPLQYDMIPNEEDEKDDEEISPIGCEKHPLNENGCLSTIIMLLQHASNLEHSQWLSILTTALTSNLALNVKWMLAQAICYAEADLKVHASVLVPAMLALIAATPKVMDGKQTLNNLHIDLLWTIIRWNIMDLPSYDSLSVCVQYLVHSCVRHRSVEAVKSRLLKTITSVLQIYGTKIRVDWTVFEEYCNNLPASSSYLLPILQRVLKSSIPLSELLPVIFAKFDAELWPKTSGLPEVFGLALSLDMNEAYLAKFWHVLDSIKRNAADVVKVLKNAQQVCPRCCNSKYFRYIIDLAPKAEKSKCLAIIAVYLENLDAKDDTVDEVFHTLCLTDLLDGANIIEAMKVVHGGFKFMSESMRDDVVSIVSQHCRNGSKDIRKQALTVMLRVFQDLVQVKYESSAKRRASSRTPILEAMGSTDGYRSDVIREVSRGMFDTDSEVAGMIREGVEMCLSKDISKRLAELFYLIFYFSQQECTELSEYGAVFLELLFANVIQDEGFKTKKFNETALPTTDVNIGFQTLTSGVTYRQKQVSNVKEIRNIDVQIPVVELFQKFLQSAKSNSEICYELCVQMLRRVASVSSDPRFDLGEVMAELLADVLNRAPNCLTPLYLEASRIFLSKVVTIDRIKHSLQELGSKLSGEPLLFYKTIYEDYVLKTEGRNFFNFSIPEDLDIEMKREDQEFSIQGLMEIFGQLANWDDLRIQDKNRIEGTLPPLLEDDVMFETAVEEYYREHLTTLDYSNWFNKMVGVYCSNKIGAPMVQYKEKWLKDAQQWPTRDFVTSSVIEAMKWPQDTVVKTCQIKPNDCLAEWAARLMIRSAHYQGDENQSECRDDELRWCCEANRRTLPTLALQAIQRNISNLTEAEAPAWFKEKVHAKRMLALKRNDNEMLRMTLDAAENHDTEHDYYLKNMILQIRKDLGILSKTDLDTVFTKINENKSSITNATVISSTDGQQLKSIYDTAMNHYDELWDEDDVSNQSSIITSMIDIIEQRLNYNLVDDHNLLMAILLNKLTYFEGVLSEGTARKILDKINQMLPNLDAFSVDHIRRISGVFPGNLLAQYQGLNDGEALDQWSKCLRLICDPQYTAAIYCQQLRNATDAESWSTIFNKMRAELFETTHGGTSYASVKHIESKLLALENVDFGDKRKLLLPIISELRSKNDRPLLLLSQLCPLLADPSALQRGAEDLRRLLALPPGVTVVKINEQVKVFVDSIRHPCVLSARLSTGAIKRYLIKTGEPLANDASVQRAVAILPRIVKGEIRSYNVRTLSEDSAIIEYLEDHERLMDLIEDTIKINEISDENLVLSHSFALEQYNAKCKKVPVDIIRSSLEARCASTQEFIFKKRMFLETLCTMTITNWLFGLGDRHLNNIMWSGSDGGVCAVDWSSVFQFGGREFVPARLTPALLAVCDVKVLEARLQNILESLRQNQILYEAFIRISFYWKGRDFKEMNYIKGILKGSMVSYQVTRDVIEDSNEKYKNNCVAILDSVFENFVSKPTYTVEEQIYILLQHCTDPRILAVVRHAWLPWI